MDIKKLRRATIASVVKNNFLGEAIIGRLTTRNLLAHIANTFSIILRVRESR